MHWCEAVLAIGRNRELLAVDGEGSRLGLTPHESSVLRTISANLVHAIPASVAMSSAAFAIGLDAASIEHTRGSGVDGISVVLSISISILD